MLTIVASFISLLCTFTNEDLDFRHVCQMWTHLADRHGRGRFTVSEEPSVPCPMLPPDVPGLNRAALCSHQLLAGCAHALVDESVHVDEGNEVVTQRLGVVLDCMVRHVEEMTSAREHAGACCRRVVPLLRTLRQRRRLRALNTGRV